MHLALPEEETEDQTTSADERGWVEYVADLWERHLPHLRKKQSAGFVKPDADKYGFKKVKEVDQTEEKKLGAAIVRDLERSKDIVEEMSGSNFEDEEEEVEVMERSEDKEEAKKQSTVHSTPHENCKSLVSLIVAAIIPSLPI